MKKILSLIALMMLCITGANAETIDDVAVCKNSYVLCFDEWDSNGTAKPGGGQLFGDGYFLDVTGGSVATSKGQVNLSVLNEADDNHVTQYIVDKYGANYPDNHYNSWRLKNAQDVIAMKVTANSKLIFFLHGNNKTGTEARIPKIATDAKLENALNDAPDAEFPKTDAGFRYEWTAPEDLTIYIGSYNGDMFLSYLIVEAPEAPTNETYTIEANVNGAGVNMDLTLAENTALPYAATFADCYRGAMGSDPAAGIQIQNADITSGTNVTLGTLNGWDTTFTINDEGTSVISLTLNIGAMTITINVAKYVPAETKTFSLVPGPWDVDGARFAAWTWSNEEDGQWIDFTKVDDNYTISIPAANTGLVLVRMNGETTENNWNEGTLWNRTGDINITDVPNNSVFTINGWGESDYTITSPAASPLDAAKAALQAAIDKAKAFNTTGLAEIIAAAEAALADENATIESIQAAAANFEAGVKDYVKYVLTTAIPMLESLNAEALTDAINTAKAALANEDVTAAELAEALLGMIEPARPYIVGILQQAVDVCKPLGIDTSAAEAALSQGDEASTVGMALTLYNLTQTAIPAIQGVLTNLKAYMTTFSGGAAEALAGEFAQLETDIANGNIAAVKNDIVALMANGKPYLQADIEKLEDYVEVLNSEDITADVAAMKKAVEEGSFANLLAAVEQFKTHFLAAAPDFVAQVKFAAAGFKDAGKTNAMEQLEAAIAAAEQAIAAEDATIVTVGLAVRNLIVAVKTHIAANSTYTIAGTKDLTGTENDWDVVEANNMTKSAEDYMYEWSAENITINAENQPQFKVVITDIEGNQTWVPASEEGNDHNWIITPNVVGDEGVFNITITYNAKTQEINVINKEWAETIAAAEALVDMNAVAVGKLLAAIATAKAATGTTADKAALQAAIEQFKADNAPLEADVTSQFPVDYQGWAGATGFVGWAAPEVTTNDGRTTPACEKYESTCANTGDVFIRTLTGLANGTYRIELYGAAAFTSGRGFESELVEGDETAVYLYAETAAGTVKQYIPAHVADNFNGTGIATAVLDGVVISDGTVKLGMYKDKAYTNWHVVQIKGVTALVLAKDLYAAEQAELAALIAKAEILQGENGKEEFQAVLAIAKEATDAKKNWYNVTEIESIIANLKTAMENYKKANWFIEFAAGEYYVINATTGLKMAAGHNYGTRGIVNEIGLDLILTPYEESRTVTFNSRVSNGGNSQFLGENLYMDSNEWGWALLHQGSGFFYILEPNSYKYINLDADNNLVLSETPCEWIIVSKDGVRAQLLDELSEATKDNPVDATGLIVAPNFNRNDLRNAEAWTVSEDCTHKNLSGGNQTNNCAESYHSTFTIMQTIENCPAGSYELTAQGFYRQDDVPEGEETPAAPVFFANEINGNVPVKTGEENGMSDASASFTNGLYTIEPIKFEVKEDGMMYIGITASTNTQWVIWDNFQLKYFGNVSTDIATVNTTVEQNNNGIYNLAGQRVVKAQKGLYIINGKKVVK